jgi:hypothetical protein
MPQPAETSLPNPSYISPQSPHTSGPVTAQTILASFIDWDRASGGQLTRQTIGQLAATVGRLLAEGVDDRHIRNALADWRGKGMHPSTLDSFVNAAMNGRGRHRRSTTNERVQEALDLAEKFRAAEQMQAGRQKELPA